MLDQKDENVHFVKVYGRPLYFANNMSGKPYGLLRYGYPDDGHVDFESSNSSIIPKAQLKHSHPNYFDDDDFFYVNNSTVSFQELLTNYTFVLWYSGRRWYVGSNFFICLCKYILI